MSRHRNVRSMNVDDEYYDDDDMYGHSVDDNYCISPSTAAEFTYHRGNNADLSSYLAAERISEESGSDQESLSQPSPRKKRQLSDLDTAKLSSCIDEVHNVLGDTVKENHLTDVILRHQFNINAVLDELLSTNEISNAASGTRKATSQIQGPKTQEDIITNNTLLIHTKTTLSDNGHISVDTVATSSISESEHRTIYGRTEINKNIVLETENSKECNVQYISIKEKPKATHIYDKTISNFIPLCSEQGGNHYMTPGIDKHSHSVSVLSKHSADWHAINSCSLSDDVKEPVLTLSKNLSNMLSSYQNNSDQSLVEKNSNNAELCKKSMLDSSIRHSSLSQLLKPRNSSNINKNTAVTEPKGSPPSSLSKLMSTRLSLNRPTHSSLSKFSKHGSQLADGSQNSGYSLSTVTNMNDSASSSAFYKMNSTISSLSGPSKMNNSLSSLSATSKMDTCSSLSSFSKMNKTAALLSKIRKLNYPSTSLPNSFETTNDIFSFSKSPNMINTFNELPDKFGSKSLNLDTEKNKLKTRSEASPVRSCITLSNILVTPSETVNKHSRKTSQSSDDVKSHDKKMDISLTDCNDNAKMQPSAVSVLLTDTSDSVVDLSNIPIVKTTSPFIKAFDQKTQIHVNSETSMLQSSKHVLKYKEFSYKTQKLTPTLQVQLDNINVFQFDKPSPDDLVLQRQQAASFNKK